MTDLSRWKRAIVHLEGAADSADAYQLHDLIRQGADAGTGLRDVRQHGTAVFVSHEDTNFLVTARHVLNHEESAQRYYADIMSDPAELEEAVAQWVWPTIFRVPSYDEILSGGGEAHTETLSNVGTGSPPTRSVTLSEPNLDLAVISLHLHQKFSTELLDLGYSPIPSTAFADQFPNEGEEVVAVGYPESTAIINYRALPQPKAMWEAGSVSLPVSSWGRVALSHAELDFFWIDVSIYPGNSGGPVIAGEQLIGIVSAQAVYDGNLMPFGKIIRADRIIQLLDQQLAKDQFWKARGV